jgi:predicted CoA-binding protein
MNTLQEIQEFLEPKKLAIAGASRNPKKFGGTVVTELIKKGFELFPVHPVATEINGVPCFKTISELPGGVENLFITTQKSQTAGLVEQAIQHGIRRIWIQQHSETPEALEIARKHNVPVISGRCIFMFADPVSSVHGFHRWISRLFGSYPK